MGSATTGIYDIYDDGGAILQRYIPDPADIPEFVKTAERVGHDAHTNMYALVMVEDGRTLKKFATADRGNTWLSSLYFAETHVNLPEDAQKVAAAHLSDACVEFDIDPPDILIALAGDGVSSNLVSVTGARLPVKVASATVEDSDYAIVREDGSSYYPLRNAVDVTTAMHYFDEHASSFIPRERREYAVKVAQVAERHGVAITEKISKHAGASWNPALEGHLTSRYLCLSNMAAPVGIKERLVKLSHAQETSTPEEFSTALERFDLDAGLAPLWDRHLADPWTATFGIEKEASTNKTYSVGGADVSGDSIRDLARRPNRLGDLFGEKVAQAFSEDPLAQFEAMPLPQKKLIAQLAAAPNE